MKACEVYFRRDLVFVVANAKTVPGWLIRSGPMFKLRRDDPPSAWGEAVLKALEGFREGVPMMEAPHTDNPEFMDLIGVKSWSTFAKNAHHLSIAYDGREVQVIPTAHAHGGFNHLTDQTVRCPPQPQAIGDALLEALDHCS